MTGIDRERLQRRRWATEQLGLAADASPDEVRAAWLRLLPQEDFVPPTASRWALGTLLGRGGEGEKRADEAASREEEERLRGEVEAFAEQFWALPPEERGRRWQELIDRCTSTAVSARLHRLAPGLDAIPMPSEADADARVMELASQVRELFVLRPGPCARTRQALLRRMAKEREEWTVAVRALRRSCPALASLGNDLLDKVQTASAETERLPQKPPPQPKPERAGEAKSSRWSIWLAVVIGLSALRGITSFSTRTPSTYPMPHSPAVPDGLFPRQKERPDPPDDLDPFFERNQIRDEQLKKLLKEQMKQRPRRNPDKGREAPDGRSP